MGEYANYKINGVTVYSAKNEYAASPMLVTCFLCADWHAEAATEEGPGYFGFKTTRETVNKRSE